MQTLDSNVEKIRPNAKMRAWL